MSQETKEVKVGVGEDATFTPIVHSTSDYVDSVLIVARPPGERKEIKARTEERVSMDVRRCTRTVS